jgi:hypothetical protein
MLQAFGQGERRPTPEEITRQGHAAWARGAAGISFFRLGTDVWPGDGSPQMGEPEYAAIAWIRLPGETLPAYTWQTVLDAAVMVADRVGVNCSEWLDAAAFWQSFDDSLLQRPYSGPPIERWPIVADARQQILELLVLSPGDLRRVTAAQAERDRRVEAAAVKEGSGARDKA